MYAAMVILALGNYSYLIEYSTGGQRGKSTLEKTSATESQRGRDDDHSPA